MCNCNLSKKVDKILNDSKYRLKMINSKKWTYVPVGKKDVLVDAVTKLEINLDSYFKDV